jgi:hypothetical protein
MCKHYHMQHNQMFFSCSQLHEKNLVYVLLELKPNEIEKVKCIEMC